MLQMLLPRALLLLPVEYLSLFVIEPPPLRTTSRNSTACEFSYMQVDKHEQFQKRQRIDAYTGQQQVAGEFLDPYLETRGTLRNWLHATPARASPT